MNDKPAPRHVTRFVEELIECGVQLARMLDHMYLHETDDPEIPPPPEVLRDLVAKTLEPSLKRRKRDIYTATSLLLETGRTIEREISATRRRSSAAPVVTAPNTASSAARPPSRTAMWLISSSRVLR